MTIEELERKLQEIDKGYSASKNTDDCLVIKYEDEEIAVQITGDDYMFDGGHPKMTKKVLTIIDQFLMSSEDDNEQD